MLCRANDAERIFISNYAGREVFAMPHDTEDYAEISRRCGYGGDEAGRWAYAVDHELAHWFLARKLVGTCSASLLAELSQHVVIPPWDAVREEALVQAFQAWCRADIRPIIGLDGTPTWHSLKSEFLWLVENPE